MAFTSTELIKFIQQHVDWVEANMLADYFDVSTRTIRNRIKSINENYPNLIVSSYKGYKINSSDYDEDVFENDDELLSRSEQILRKLIVANSPISVYDLADEMFISDTSFERSLKLAKSSLEPFELTIERKRNKISLVGKERKKRKLINYMISKENQGAFIINKSATKDFLSDEIDVSALKKKLSNIFKENSVFINDYGFNTVLFHTLIMLDRVLNGQSANDETFYSNIAENRIIIEIKEYLESVYQVQLSAIELHYLNIIISNNTNTFDVNMIDAKNISNYIEPEYIQLTKKIVNDLTTNFCLEQFPEEFLVNLTIHIRNLVIRVKNDTYTHNPLAKNFKLQFPLIYDMATFIIKELNDYLGVKIIDDEIAFIAFHIGSYIENKNIHKDKINASYIYSDYHGTHLQTLAKIRDAFGSDLYITSVYSANNYNLSRIEADLIISSCQIDTPVPNIQVNVFLTDTDMMKIRNAIDLIKIQRKKESLKKDLNHFLHKELFKKEYYCDNNIEMIKNLSKECIEMGLCDSSFTDEVLEREMLTSTSFKNGIAIPHSLKSSSKHSFMSVVVNKKKMLWKSNYVNLIILIGSSNNDRERFKNVYSKLVEVLYDPVNVRALTKCDTYEEFIEKVVNLI